jgi:hypothetical protein
MLLAGHASLNNDKLDHLTIGVTASGAGRASLDNDKLDFLTIGVTASGDQWRCFHNPMPVLF